MKGYPHDSAVREAAVAMRGEGRLQREIAAELGVSRGTVAQWCADPSGAKQRKRRRRYEGVCESCGATTDGSSGRGNAPRVCKRCREWTPEQIIQAIRDWAQTHGGIPPTTTEWQKTTDGTYPSAESVVNRMGWNEALLAAGFDLRCDRRSETQREMERMLREGCSTRHVAEHFGWTVANVHMRLRTRGTTVTELRTRQAA